MLPIPTTSRQNVFSILSFLCFLLFMGISPVSAQEQPQRKAVLLKSIEKNKTNESIEEPTDPATYPGGMKAFNRDFVRNFKLSRKLIVDTRVVLMFIVETDGSLSDLRVVENPGLDIAKAALAALAKTKNWIPAKHNGELVSSQFTLPITIGADYSYKTN